MIPDLADPLTSPFWLAASRKELLICTCNECENDIWYPRLFCPTCKEKSTWRKLSGEATLLSWTTSSANINSMFDNSYLPAIVVPQDAPKIHLVTQLILENDETPRCDMRLKVTYRKIHIAENPEFIAPLFMPA